jgi:hypothetical protein
MVKEVDGKPYGNTAGGGAEFWRKNDDYGRLAACKKKKRACPISYS